MGTGLPRACEVLVLSMSPTADRTALMVLGVRVGDCANRPVTFAVKTDEMKDLMADLQYSEEDLIIEIDERYVVPVIRHREALEPTPVTPAT